MGTKGLAARAPKKKAEESGAAEITLAELGARIEARRIELGMTRPQLAVASDVDPSTVYRLEKGKHSPGLDKLQRIAGVLGTTVAKLVKP